MTISINNLEYVDGDGTYLRPDARPQARCEAYRSAVAASGWRQIHTDTQELDVNDWIEDYPDRVVARQFTWGTSGWEASIRHNPDLDEALYLLTLHGEVVDVSFEITLEQALGRLDNAQRDAAAHVSGELRLMAAPFTAEFERCSDGCAYVTSLDARWRYQALTGLHSDVVNALIAHGASSDDFLLVATTSGPWRHEVLEDFFLSHPKRTNLDRLAASHSPLAYLATPTEWMRLHAPEGFNGL